MKPQTQKAVVIEHYGGKPEVKKIPIPELKQGEVLVKVDASTINPSDRVFIRGSHFHRKLPSVCGQEGTGRVVEAKGNDLQHWIGKRVTFGSLEYGTWCEYSVAKPPFLVEIADDVPLQCAASGLVNPLSVLGMIENYKSRHGHGMIFTAAASPLGRMLNKRCQIQKIPLFCIVREEQEAEILKLEGAKHILVTKGDWVEVYKSICREYNFDCLYDAIGGGPVTTALIESLESTKLQVIIFGVLQDKPVTITNRFLLFEGLKIEGWLFNPWWVKIDQETRSKVLKNFSVHLKNELSTHTYKEVTMENIEQGIEWSVSKATQGKTLIKIT